MEVTNFKPTKGSHLVDVLRDAITWIGKCQEGDCYRELSIELYLVKIALNVADSMVFYGDMPDEPPMTYEEWKPFEIQGLRQSKQYLAEMRGLIEMLEKKYTNELRERLTE